MPSHNRTTLPGDTIDENDEFPKENPAEKKHILRNDEPERIVINGVLMEIPRSAEMVAPSPKKEETRSVVTGHTIRVENTFRNIETDEARRLREERQRQELELLKEIETRQARIKT
jgi:hypothetical protein